MSHDDSTPTDTGNGSDREIPAGDWFGPSDAESTGISAPPTPSTRPPDWFGTMETVLPETDDTTADDGFRFAPEAPDEIRTVASGSEDATDTAASDPEPSGATTASETGTDTADGPTSDDAEEALRSLTGTDAGSDPVTGSSTERPESDGQADQTASVADSPADDVQKGTAGDTTAGTDDGAGLLAKLKTLLGLR